MEESTFKKKVVIATHNGNFHADDIFAVATLFLMLEKQGISENNIQVIRTRDPQKIAAADYVVDVGGEYDPIRKRFDHHQKGGAGVRNNGIRYASFGLVWKEYGEELSEGNKMVADKIERILIMPIDGPDNSQSICTSIYKDVEPYTIYDFFKTYRLQRIENDEDLLDKNFTTTVLFAMHVLKFELLKAQERVRTNLIVQRIYNEAPDKKLIIFEGYYPWEEVLAEHGDTRVAVYERPLKDGWNAQVVGDGEYGKSRIYFPKTWAGLRDEELEIAAGIKGSIFCSNGLWLVAAKTKEAALALAELALREAGE